MKKAYLIIDYRCNNGCIICANMRNEKYFNKTLNLKEIKKFILKLNFNDEDILEISGGEPTICKSFIEVCKFFKENSKGKLVVLSNSRRFADVKFAKQAAKYIDIVSSVFYSHVPKIHDSITQRKNSFEETKKGLKNMELFGVKIYTKVIPLKQNYKRLKELITLLYDTFNDPFIFFSGLDLRGYAESNKARIAVKYATLKPYLEEAIDFAKGFGKDLYIFNMPMCILDPCYWDNYSMDMDKISSDIKFLMPDRNKFDENFGISVGRPSKDCVYCKLEKRCFWGWKGYVQYFGNDEFRSPVKSDTPNNPAKDIQDEDIYQISDIMRREILKEKSKPGSMLPEQLCKRLLDHAKVGNIKKELQNPDFICIVSRAGDKIEGFIVGYFKGDKECYLDYAWANSDLIKDILLKKFEEFCRSRNIKKIFTNIYEHLENGIKKEMLEEKGFVCLGEYKEFKEFPELKSLRFEKILK